MIWDCVAAVASVPITPPNAELASATTMSLGMSSSPYVGRLAVGVEPRLYVRLGPTGNHCRQGGLACQARCRSPRTPSPEGD
jgi:hypothetical protein